MVNSSDDDIKDIASYHNGWRDEKGVKRDEGCFISTACAEAVGLPDDCTQLRALRNFRDAHLLCTARGRALIDQYYIIAPLLLRRIQQRPDSREILSATFHCIADIVSLIEREEDDAAIAGYTALINSLWGRFR